MFWDFNESKYFYFFNVNDEIYVFVFFFNCYWFCVVIFSSIIIFDFEKKSKVDEFKFDFVNVGKKSCEFECVFFVWSVDGQILFVGYMDNIICVWGVMFCV